ncbi:MAG: methionyl-tRNA synthetase, partial [Bacteroidetes bacterium]|nr:methionyl-tRNA synthetase [Bacteroidota bacterium]
KIEDKQIEDVVHFLEHGSAGPPSIKSANVKPFISIEDFKKVDLRLGKVISAERVPKSDKLLKLQVEIGPERKQIIAGIAQHYSADQMVGKMVVVVANLQPAKLMGQESQGMLLAASDSDGKLSVVTVDSELASGSAVK